MALSAADLEKFIKGSETTVERAGTSGLMAAEPCLAERAEGDMSKDKVKKDKKKKKEGKKKKEEEAGTKGQEQPSDATDENLATARDEVEGKQSNKSKKSKRELHDAGEASAGDQAVAREDKKRKKEHPTALEESNQKRALDTAVDNPVAKSDKVEGNQSSKSKKSKSKRDDAGEASACDQAVTREDEKIKKTHPVVLEESSQPKNYSEVENGEIKERRKEADKSFLESSENASAGGEEADGDGKNDKKKKKSKEGTEQEGIKEKEKASQSKNKGKRVSFVDSTVVFETEGGNAEGTEGGNKKEKKAAQPKNKGKRVSFADSAEVFEGGDGEGTEGGKKKIKVAQSKNKGKRVSFADSAEMFETEGGDNEEGGSSDKSEFVHGLRFTPDEDATLMEAITDFIEMKQLGEKGLEMIRNARKHKELKHCWDFIGKSLPYRPYTAIYKRARTLLNRSDKRGWTKDEKDRIRSFVQNNGTDWKTLAHELGKWNIHVKDTWRRIKSPNLKKGHWTQDEHQKLFDLVNLDLRMKAHENKHPDNRKLRDNISWEAISDKLTTRNHKNCCLKWYDTLASPMVREGIWADVDDYLLVEALQKDDAVCIEDVDWDSLLDHRSSEVCRQRWNQMVRGLGGHREKPFIEQVDVLSGRYCSEMIEYRKDNDETRAGDADGDKKKKKSKESEEEPGVANAKVKKKKKQSKETEEPGVANAEAEKKTKKKSKEGEEEPGAANAQVEKKKKRKSKESEEPGVANAEVEKKKKKQSKESEEPGVANAEAEKKMKKKSKESEEEPGAANAQVGKKKKRKSKESEEPCVADAEVKNKNKKKSNESEEEPGVANNEVKKKKSSESEEDPGAANNEVEKRKKSEESEERGVANNRVKKKSKESEEAGAANAEAEKKNTVTQDDDVVASMEAESGKKDKRRKEKADH